MERQEVYTLVLKKIKGCFTPTSEELQIIEKRLEQYSNEELKHFEKNFAIFGVDEIIACLYELKFNE